MSDDVKRDYAALLGMLAPTPKREAIASPRGYDWQKWLTVERWVALKQDERLWVEWAEDLTVAAPTGAFTIQAKDRDGEITLGQAPVIELIDLAIKRGAKVKTVIWTRATAGHERGRPFGEPGIVHWKRVVAGEADGESLRQFLLKAALSKKSATALQSVTNIKLPALLARIDWQLDEPPITELRVRVQDAVGFRLEHLGDPAASIRKEAAAAALFDLVSQVGANLTRSERMLDLRMADEALARHMGQALLGTIPLLQPLLAVANSEVDQAPDGRAVASKALDTVISEAVQHEVETRFAFVIRRMTFPEAYRTNGAWPLALEILEGIYGDLPDDLARRVLFKGARTAAIRGNISDAEKLFDAGIARIGTSSSLAPEARL
ncbi:MAG TPA: hypothetical protein VG722_03225, partial [Tepidisphaeraceae bacterium]|nr:hypothetical protein [Tepidisphaeraceae bacterium]